MSFKPRVLIVDDHPVVRYGLGQMLAQDGRFVVAGEAASPAEARRLMEDLQPGLAILDLVLGGRDGLELVEDLKAMNPRAHILVYSAQPEMIYAPRAFQAGASGYLMKDAGVERVPDVLATLMQGERHASEAVQRAVFHKAVGGQPLQAGTLSARELQVLRLLGSGRGTADIAEELSLSMKTIGTYRERLKSKLGAENARQLELRAAEFIRSGTL